MAPGVPRRPPHRSLRSHRPPQARGDGAASASELAAGPRANRVPMATGGREHGLARQRHNPDLRRRLSDHLRHGHLAPAASDGVRRRRRGRRLRCDLRAPGWLAIGPVGPPCGHDPGRLRFGRGDIAGLRHDHRPSERAYALRGGGGHRHPRRPGRRAAPGCDLRILSADHALPGGGDDLRRRHRGLWRHNPGDRRLAGPRHSSAAGAGLLPLSRRHCRYWRHGVPAGVAPAKLDRRRLGVAGSPA